MKKSVVSFTSQTSLHPRSSGPSAVVMKILTKIGIKMRPKAVSANKTRCYCHLMFRKNYLHSVKENAGRGHLHFYLSAEVSLKILNG